MTLLLYCGPLLEGDCPMLFFSERKTPRTPPGCSARKPFRPRLDPLEDRCLLSAGALDPTFGSGGMVSVSGLVDTGAVVVQPDGKIVITSSTSAGRQSFHVLKRFNPNGSVDTGFG